MILLRPFPPPPPSFWVSDTCRVKRRTLSDQELLRRHVFFLVRTRPPSEQSPKSSTVICIFILTIPPTLHPSAPCLTSRSKPVRGIHSSNLALPSSTSTTIHINKPTILHISESKYTNTIGTLSDSDLTITTDSIQADIIQPCRCGSDTILRRIGVTQSGQAICTLNLYSFTHALDTKRGRSLT